jgi:hypothetical protein
MTTTSRKHSHRIRAKKNVYRRVVAAVLSLM